jgi:hypothetical protein
MTSGARLYLFTIHGPWAVVIVIALISGTILWRLYRAATRDDDEKGTRGLLLIPVSCVTRSIFILAIMTCAEVGRGKLGPTHGYTYRCSIGLKN